MNSKNDIAIFWYRRDLRSNDNAGLYHALKAGTPVLPVFIFDTQILEQLENPFDRRVDFIYQALQALQQQLLPMGTCLCVLHATPLNAFKQLLQQYNIKAVYTNHDYEPYAIQRDGQIAGYLAENGIPFYTCKDQVIFEKQEVVKNDGTPYTVFTPYSKCWKQKLHAFYLKSYPCQKYYGHFYPTSPFAFPTLQQIGFKKTDLQFSLPVVHKKIIGSYEKTRNLPAVEGTSGLSTHLRFGTGSIRKLVHIAQSLNPQWLNELIWREFFMSILYHFPKVIEQPFKAKYAGIAWRNNEAEFEKWCQGQTGYPLVDAGMRELNSAGLMHNRVRMVAASFLTKHLLIDWRWGEAYFAQKLLDFELSSNNGNWQWAAGCGCDAAPYFRIFNPAEQARKFDPQAAYIKKWVPEFGTLQYARPMVEHTFARNRALKVYKDAVAGEE